MKQLSKTIKREKKGWSDGRGILYLKTDKTREDIGVVDLLTDYVSSCSDRKQLIHLLVYQ